jgi:hypothetical protein
MAETYAEAVQGLLSWFKSRLGLQGLTVFGDVSRQLLSGDLRIGVTFRHDIVLQLHDFAFSTS